MTGQRSGNKPCVVFAANRGYALKTSRASLIQRFMEAGWNVVLATSNDLEARALRDTGAVLEPIEFHRRGFSPLHDYSAYRRLQGVFRRHRPKLVQCYHAKPIILSALAARRSCGRSVYVVSTITGLGRSLAGYGLSSYLAPVGYRLALRHTDIAVFQNRDDRSLFVDKGWVAAENAKTIVGSGVDLNRFRFVDRHTRRRRERVVAMVGRLLKEKGVPEFVAVAGTVRNRELNVRFMLVGEAEPRHPDSVSEKWLCERPEIQYRGRIDDIEKFLATADVFLYPSYYREGVPRVVMEAASTGLATIGFDVPGVREIVRDGSTGYLVPPNDVEALTERVLELLEDDALRHEMGRKARELMETEFGIDAVNERYLQVYRDLGLDVD